MKELQNNPEQKSSNEHTHVLFKEPCVYLEESYTFCF